MHNFIKEQLYYRALKDFIWYGSTTQEENSNNEHDLIDETENREAFRKWVRDLNAAYGYAEKLNAFIQQYAPAYAAAVRFQPTLWDYIHQRA